MRILNGRINGDSLGRPTFHGNNGTSVVDYVICNQHLIPKVKHLVVKSPNYLSDHSQVITCINLYKNTNTDNITTSQPQYQNYLYNIFGTMSQAKILRKL